MGAVLYNNYLYSTGVSEEHRLKLFENRMLRKICASKGRK
jgi:hypothetical protein